MTEGPFGGAPLRMGEVSRRGMSCRAVVIRFAPVSASADGGRPGSGQRGAPRGSRGMWGDSDSNAELSARLGGNRGRDAGRGRFRRREKQQGGHDQGHAPARMMQGGHDATWADRRSWDSMPGRDLQASCQFAFSGGKRKASAPFPLRLWHRSARKALTASRKIASIAGLRDPGQRPAMSSARPQSRNSPRTEARPTACALVCTPSFRRTIFM